MRKIKHIIISTLVPLGIMGLISLIAYIVCGAGLTASDCYEQYVPFMSAYYDVLTGHKSMMYSLSGSMGYDFWAVFAYYLVSPLNLIILFFGKAKIVYAVELLIIIKLAMCGGAFSIFLGHRVPGAKCSRIVMFSAMYALCGFMVGYCWNIMWLDGLVLFPLVMTGLDRMMENGEKWYVYTFFLSAQIIISYFIGYMTCIFIFLYFFTYEFADIKDFGKKFMRIGLSSVLAVGISAAILIPSLGGVQSTYISDEKLPAGFYGSFAESLETILLGVQPVGIEFERQYANMFLTTFGLLTAYIYITSGSIKTGDKIRHIMLLAVIIVSFNFKPANFVWHGLHEQTGIPNRFAFMAVFVMLSMGFKVCTQDDEDKIRKSPVWAAWGLVAVTALLIGFFNRKVIIQAVVTCIFAAMYAIIIVMSSGKLKSVLTQVFVYLEILIVVILGLFTSSGIVIGDYGRYVDDFDEINRNKEKGYYREKIDETYNPDEIYFENDMQCFEPKDMTINKIVDNCRFMKNIGHQSVVNEGTVYGINSMSLFNTFNNYSQTRFYCRTGATGGTNNVMYFGDNPFMDMMLGIKYYYTRYADVYTDAYEYVKRTEEVNIYKNRYALSTGYVIPEKLALDNSELDEDPFISLNNICMDITGRNIVNHEKKLLGKSGEYELTVTDGSDELMIRPAFDNMLKYEVYVNGKEVYRSRRSQCVIDIGRLERGDKVKISVTPVYGMELSGDIYTAYMDMDVLRKAYDVLSQSQLDITDSDDAYLKGNIKLSENSNVLLTIPYSKGWSIWVDGKNTECGKWKDTFVMLELSGGIHEIEMRYETPGLKEGAVISSVCLIIYIIALSVTFARRRHQGQVQKH